MTDSGNFQDQVKQVTQDRNHSQLGADESLQLKLLGLPKKDNSNIGDAVNPTPLIERLFSDGLAVGPQAPTPSHFFGAKPADNQAARLWSAVDSTQGADLRLVHEFRVWAGKSAKQRLEGSGGLHKSPASNDVDNLRALARIDPDKLVRGVPVAPPANPDTPVYLNEHMQRCLLAYLTVKNSSKSMTIGNQRNIKLIDVELAYQAGAPLDKTTARILHQDAIQGLGEIFNNPYTAAERINIARRANLGLNESEVEWLHNRLEKAEAYLRANP